MLPLTGAPHTCIEPTPVPGESGDVIQREELGDGRWEISTDLLYQATLNMLEYIASVIGHGLISSKEIHHPYHVVYQWQTLPLPLVECERGTLLRRTRVRHIYD